MFDTHEYLHAAIPREAFQAEKLIQSGQAHDRCFAFTPEWIKLLKPDSRDIAIRSQMGDTHGSRPSSESATHWKAAIRQDGFQLNAGFEFESFCDSTQTKQGEEARCETCFEYTTPLHLRFTNERLACEK